MDGIAEYAVNATSVEMTRMGLNDFVDTDTNVAVLEGNRVSITTAEAIPNFV